MSGEQITMEKMIDYSYLRSMGFPKNQSRRIIRLAKKELVKQGYGFYNGRRVGLVPFSAVSKILALPYKEGENRNANN